MNKSEADKLILDFYTNKCKNHKDCGWKASGWLSQEDQDYRFKCVLNYLHNQDSILDIGCGQGDVLKYINPLSYLGCDSCPEMLKYAKQKFPNAKFEQTDILDLNCQHFEIALAIGTFARPKNSEKYEYLSLSIKSIFEITDKIIIVIPSIANINKYENNTPIDAYDVEKTLSLALSFTDKCILDNRSLKYEMILCLDKH